MQRKRWHKYWNTTKIIQAWLTSVPEYIVADSQTGKQTVRQTDRQAGRQAGRQADRRENGQADSAVQSLLPQLFTSTNTEASSLVRTHTVTQTLLSCLLERWRWEPSPGRTRALESSWLLFIHSHREANQTVAQSQAIQPSSPAEHVAINCD